MDRTIEATIDKYKKEEGEEYVSLTIEQAKEAIMKEETLDRSEKFGMIRIMSAEIRKHGYPPFLFVSPYAYRRWKIHSHSNLKKK